MSYKTTNALAELMLAAVKTALDGGNLTIFSGTVPANADDALDMAADHTILAVLTVDGDGLTGITFDPAVGPVVSKAAAESWLATVSFSGTQDTETTLTPTFFRITAAGDDGTGEATIEPRLQGTAGGPSSPATLKLGGTTVTDNGSNTVGVGMLNVRLSSIG